MHNAASHAKGLKGQDEEVTKQIRYLAQGADSPIDVSNVLQEALGLLSEFPTFVPKLLGLQLPRRAAKQTVIGLIGSVDYYIGTQVHQLALTVIFSSLADPRRHFQLVCPQQSLPFHLTDSTGRVVLDTCPHTNLLKTVRWFISVVEAFGHKYICGTVPDEHRGYLGSYGRLSRTMSYRKSAIQRADG